MGSRVLVWVEALAPRFFLAPVATRREEAGLRLVAVFGRFRMRFVVSSARFSSRSCLSPPSTVLLCVARRQPPTAPESAKNWWHLAGFAEVISQADRTLAETHRSSLGSSQHY